MKDLKELKMHKELTPKSYELINTRIAGGEFLEAVQVSSYH